jgi:hypothetical protein
MAMEVDKPRNDHQPPGSDNITVWLYRHHLDSTPPGDYTVLDKQITRFVNTLTGVE